MPPTPFQPSHQTPFKSTVSSSQQSRVHHTPFESEPSTQISISDIDPSEWTYHAEGGKNVLLSFKPLGGIEASKCPFSTPTCTFALRIPKSLPPKTAAEAQQQDEEQQAEQFTNSIIVPLLGNADVLPKCIRIPIMTARDRDIIDTLSARIEMQRPAARRAHPARIRPETLSFIYAVQDVTASTLSAPSSPVLCVEIKPKWGFLPLIDSLPPSSPNVEIKAQYSRYRMHRVARMAKEAAQSMTTEQFEKLYDPLDLYSADEQRKAKAISALWRDWNDSAGKTNNLRLFWNGHVVSPHDKSTLEHVAEFLGVSKGGDENTFVDALTRQLVAELSKPSLPSPTADAEAVSVLSRLAQLQSALDPLDVEGLAQLWLHRIKSHTLGQVPANTQNLPPALTSSLAVSDLLPILESFLTASSASGELRLEDAVQAFLVSASFKDCSLLIRVSQVDGGVESETKLVDLDRKPFAKLSSMQNTDNEVCAAFIAWLSTLSEAPPASIAP